MSLTPASHKHFGLWDKLGIATSAVCLIHCLALPVLLPLLPMLALMKHTDVHGALLVPIVGLSGLGVLPGYLRHRARRVVLFALAGIALCAAAVGVEVLFDWHALDAPLTVCGGLMLISAHIANLRLTRRSVCSGSGAA